MRIGDLRSILRERYGDKVRTPLIAAERGLFGRRLPGVGARPMLGAQAPALADDLVSALEARALWVALRVLGVASGPENRLVRRSELTLSARNRCSEARRCRPFLLSPLVKWSFAALGGAMVVHWVVKEVRRINEELDNAKRVRVPIADQENRPTLRRDPRTGEYRP